MTTKYTNDTKRSRTRIPCISRPSWSNSELPQDQIAHVGVRHRPLDKHAALRAEQDAPLGFGRSRGAVGAFYERRVERNALRGKVEMQFNRVVAGLIGDIDRAGESGAFAVVEPIVVGLPA